MPLNISIILESLIPPQVAPAQPPVNIIRMSMVLDSSGHRSKSSVEKPEVDIIDDTVKKE